MRITAEDFRAILEQAPAVRDAVIALACQRIVENQQQEREVETTPLASFLDQGLMEAQSLLVLDLTKCTRCDECTKACADTHQGVTRLIREGLRFDKFLVASSCRSCLDPYCMVGCPVGSIRRRESREIIIENWCIGCGLCSENCPYGNINMVEEVDRVQKAVVRKATTCDLCSSLGPNSEPSCVYACPHDAAHRMKGTELLDLVRKVARIGKGFKFVTIDRLNHPIVLDRSFVDADGLSQGIAFASLISPATETPGRTSPAPRRNRRSRGPGAQTMARRRRGH